MMLSHNFSVSRRDSLKRLGAAGLGVLGASAGAQDTWPNKPIRWIVPFAPGGTSSIVARTVAAELTKQMGVSFVIDNKGGGGGVPAMQELLRAPADAAAAATTRFIERLQREVLPKIQASAQVPDAQKQALAKLPGST
ncbi:MAG: hypothetical protein RL468_2426, partial [Pseudomonadota bacterium]